MLLFPLLLLKKKKKPFYCGSLFDGTIYHGVRAVVVLVSGAGGGWLHGIIVKKQRQVNAGSHLES